MLPEDAQARWPNLEIYGEQWVRWLGIERQAQNGRPKEFMSRESGDAQLKVASWSGQRPTK